MGAGSGRFAQAKKLVGASGAVIDTMTQQISGIRCIFPSVQLSPMIVVSRFSADNPKERAMSLRRHHATLDLRFAWEGSQAPAHLQPVIASAARAQELS